jgi:excisionase family DNA binding protein
MTDIVRPIRPRAARGPRKAPPDVAALVQPQPLGLTRLAYSVDEVAAMLGLPKATLYHTIRSGHLPVVRFGTTGKSIRIMAADLAAWIARQQEDTALRQMWGEGD